MPETAKINHIPTTDLGFFALKPRQVLLALQQKQHQSSSMANQLTAERKTNLLHSVVLYLHRNGFSKTHKRFLKEAQIQGDGWKTSSFDLEDMYCKYLDTGNGGHSNFEGNKEQDQHEDEAHERKGLNNPGDTITKKKKKKNTGDKKDTIVCKTEIDNGHAKSASNTDEVLKDHKLSESNVKSKPKEAGTISGSLVLADLKSEASKEDVPGSFCDIKAEGSEKLKDKKKKKKSVLTSESFVGNENRSTLVSEGKQETSEYLASQSCNKIVEEATTKKEKKKKIKSNKLDTNSSANDSVEEKLVITDNQRASQTIENGDTHSKDSKKRKRRGHDGNENHNIEGEYIEESKRRKTEEAKESKDVRQKRKSDEGVGNKIQIDNVSIVDDKKQGSGIRNGDLENALENSAREKSIQKQHNGSSEPRTINAFQRVKADEVEFVDDRLRDNSYWAKGGADSGYGAKAQEILGQVKGRDFRHEKTKKKRGSYRGGQIDLQSHSIKFNYSDED